MDNKKSFTPTARKKVLISKDFREVLIKQETSIIEQRIIVNILSSIKEVQSQFISVKPLHESVNAKQLSFDDYFDGWANQGTVDFILTLSNLNPGQKMKNLVVKTALISMTNMNWLQLKDEAINGYKAVPFILEPSWNRNYIFFKMDKAVLQHLTNMSQYFSLHRNLPYQISSNNTLRFLMWILKFKKFGGVTMEYHAVLKELFIHREKYESRSKFERDFLHVVKADLDGFNDISFNYSFEGSKYSFVLYDTLKSVGRNEKFASINDLQVERSLKYLKRKRLLSESQLKIVRDFYKLRGYDDLTKKLKRKIGPEMLGENFIKAVLKLLDQ
ncbi:MAG: hypothetical protein L6264_08580 [Weeksellaceae bacterium]|nr:hypothetical protein [Weeksellaceae bacterium]